MALHYQTEYRLGNRGRVCRSYTGFQAFLAITIDLVFGLLFELVFATIGLAIDFGILAVHLAEVGMLQLYRARAGRGDDLRDLRGHAAIRLDSRDRRSTPVAGQERPAAARWSNT